MDKIDIIDLWHQCKEKFQVADDARDALQSLYENCLDESRCNYPVEVVLEALVNLAEDQQDLAHHVLTVATRIGKSRVRPQLEPFQPELVGRLALSHLFFADGGDEFGPLLQKVCDSIEDQIDVDGEKQSEGIASMLYWIWRARAIHEFLHGDPEQAAIYLRQCNEIAAELSEKDDEEDDDQEEDDSDAEEPVALVSTGIPLNEHSIMAIIKEIMSLSPLRAYQSAYDLIGSAEGKTEYQDGEAVLTDDASRSIGARLGLFLVMTKNDDKGPEPPRLFAQAKQLISEHIHTAGLDNYVAGLEASSLTSVPDDISRVAPPQNAHELIEVMGIATSLSEADQGDAAVQLLEIAQARLDQIDVTRADLRNFHLVFCKSLFGLAETSEQQEVAELYRSRALEQIDLAIGFEDEQGRPKGSLYNRKSKILYDSGRYPEALACSLEALSHCTEDEKSLRASIVAHCASKVQDEASMDLAVRTMLKSYVLELMTTSSLIERLALAGSEHLGYLQFVVGSLCDGGQVETAFRFWEASKAIHVTLALAEPDAYETQMDTVRRTNILEQIERFHRLAGKSPGPDWMVQDIIDRRNKEFEDIADQIVTDALESELSLRTGELYLSYCLHKGQGWLFILDGPKLSVHSLSFGFEESKQRKTWKHGERILPPDLDGAIAAAGIILISPDGGLWGFDFIGANDYFIHKVVALIESLNVIVKATHREPPPGPIAVCGASYVGVEGPPPLLLAELEISQVIDAYAPRQVKASMQEDFTKAGLSDLMTSMPRALHISGHAVFKRIDEDKIGGSTLESGIIVLGEGHASHDTMTIRDFERLSAPFDLVILSCCESALGEPLTEGLAGLPLGFRSLGVRALVGTRRSTPELGALFVMRRLHSFLAGGLTIGETLQQLRVWRHDLTQRDAQQMSEWFLARAETKAWLEAHPDQATPMEIMGAIEEAVDLLVLIGDPHVKVSE